MTGATVFTNARIVTATEVVRGSLAVARGIINGLTASGSALPAALDLEGDYLMPGFVELHTDNLEKHFGPRPGVRWPAKAAVVAHDAQVAAAGITTVFDALALGDVVDGSARIDGLTGMREAIAEAASAGMLKAEHFLHLRCELSYGGVMELLARMIDDPRLKLVSLMDHTPGQRQFADVHKYRFYYQKKYGMSDEVFERFLADRQRDHEAHSARHRREIVMLCNNRSLVLASHDDASLAHVAEAVTDGMTIAEFPTTIDAARASKEAGMAVLMGGPNLVLGGSHSGNIAARQLAELQLLDIVSSDYVPSSLVHSVFALTQDGIEVDLPVAVRMVSGNAARAAGLTDRGEIGAGLRADLVRVALVDGTPVVRAVWREGVRVA